MPDDQQGLFPELHPARNGNGRKRQRLFIPKLLFDASKSKWLDDRIEEAHAILVKWADLETSGKLAKKTEKTLHGEFLADVLGRALGYTLFSGGYETWDLEAEYAVAGGHADAAIGQFAAGDRPPPRALLELKGPTSNIDRDRSSGRTPVQQVWDYLNEVPLCPWGVVSNIVSFRLYHRTKTTRTYEHFTLQELRDKNRFREFYCLFERGGFLPALAGQKPRCDDLLERSERKQREVGAELYTLYHDQRISLIRRLRRPPHDFTVDQAIHVAQKLLDRIIFIAFCEDRRLLPSGIINYAWNVSGIIEHDNPRWRSFKGLFKRIDTGDSRLYINAYNGELFKPNKVDGIQLDDEWTNLFTEIAAYDFENEVNVDVLGHLFEQSITDLEVLRENPDADAPAATSKKAGRRKREGVYYTPTHITKYIVEQSIGPCLKEQYAALAAELELDLAMPPGQRTGKKWIQFARGQNDTLRRFRVCDPACGSGAFLIEAFNYLEGRYEEVIDDLVALGACGEQEYDQISSTILRENLFGVDLSAEAVEITKLALWIRTAELGKPLSNLSANIKCGNSVVEDPAADPKALVWSVEFAPVFAEGGFDCVIGNPPYVKLQNFRKRQPLVAAYLVANYRSAQTGNFDLYLPFIERGLGLLKPAGRLGMIAPSVWLFNEYGRGLRELVAERRCLERFVDFKSHQVFEDATTYTALQFFVAGKAASVQAAAAPSGHLDTLSFFEIPSASLGGDAWALVGQAEQRLLDKLREGNPTLGDVAGQIFQGLITSADSVYHLIQTAPGRYYSKALNGTVEIEDEMLRPLVSGDDAVPFATPPTETFLIFPYRVTDDECRLLSPAEMQKYRRCWKYLKENEARLRAREANSFDDAAWYRFGRNQNIDKQHLPKVGVPQTVKQLSAFADTAGSRCFNNVRINGILPKHDRVADLWFILALLNSRSLDYAFRHTAKPKARGYFEANKQFIAPLPIPETKNRKPLIELSKRLSGLHEKRLAIERGVVRRFQIDLTPRTLLADQQLPPSVPGKLQAFDALPLSDLIPALEKFAKRRFNPRQRAEWDKYLTSETTKLSRVKRDIADAMQDLNERVDALFRLSPDEIRVIDAG